jgi:hypothetical protein
MGFGHGARDKTALVLRLAKQNLNCHILVKHAVSKLPSHFSSLVLFLAIIDVDLLEAYTCFVIYRRA